MENTVTLVKKGIRIEFAGGSVVTLSYKEAEKLQYAIAKELEKHHSGQVTK